GTANEQVVAGAAGEGVVPAAADQGVVAIAADQGHVLADVAIDFQFVVAPCGLQGEQLDVVALQVIGHVEGESGQGPAPRGVGVGREGEGAGGGLGRAEVVVVVVGGDGQGVAAGTAAEVRAEVAAHGPEGDLEDVVAALAVQPVLAAAGNEGVVAVAAVQRV